MDRGVTVERGRRLGRWLVLGGGAAVFFAVLLSGDKGLVRYGEMQRYRQDLEGRIAALRAGNAVLSEEVRRLGSDPATLEGLARTRLQMVRPGEVVFLLPGDARDAER